MRVDAEFLKSKWQMIQEAFRTDWKWPARFVLLLALFIGALIPANHRLKHFSVHLTQRQHEIDLAKKAGLNYLSVTEFQEIRAHSEKFLSGYILLSQVTSVLDKISEEASNHHLRVIRIHSDSPVALVAAGGGDVMVNGKKLSRLPIHIRLETNFRNLGEFLKGLSNNSKALFAVDDLILEPTSGEGENNLRCDLTVSYFSV